MNIFLKFFCFFLITLNTFSLGEVELEQTFNRIEIELKEIEKGVITSTQRDQIILDLKIKLSDYLTTLSKSEDISQISKTTIELDKFSNDFIRWENDASLLSDHIGEISSSLDQIDEVVTKLDTLLLRREFSSLRKKTEYFLEIVKSHRSFLTQSKTDIDAWKKLVQEKLNKSFNDSLFEWNGEALLKELNTPLFIMKANVHAFVLKSISHSFKDYTDQQKRNFLSSLVFAVLVSLVFIKGASFLVANYFSQNSSNREISRLGPVVKDLFESKKIVVMSSFSVAFLWLNEGVNAVEINIFLALILSTVLVITWRTLGVDLFEEISKQIYEIEGKCKPSISMNILIILFIYFKSLDSYLLINNIHFSVITSILFLIIFFKMSRSIFGQIKNKDLNLKSFSFLSFIKISTLIFSSLLFIGALANLVGYFEAGKALISITLKNLSFVIISAFFYYLINTKLENHVKAKSTSSRKDLFNFVETSIPIGIVLLLCVLFSQTVFNTFYQYGDFYSASIIKIGDFSLTVDMPIKIILSTYFLRLIYLFLVFLVENYLLDIFKIQPKYLPNIVTIIRYSFIMIFISVLASLLGMTYKNIVILASALGVGIGFGLQNIANNFVSGIILIFEQPIRVGDVIEVNGQLAKVRHIGIRSVIVTTLENSSVIIPNSDILSNKLTNWTFANNTVVLKCNVGVAYGSDVELVQKILMEVAVSDPDVQSDPLPQILFDEFADSSLNFVVKVWINRPFEFMPIKSRILSNIDKAFRVNNISIPFPQRDIHIIGEKS